MKSYQQLDLAERCPLAELGAQGLGTKAIAKTMGRHRSTIYREVQRNRATHDQRYRSVRAQEHAVARRGRSKRNGRLGEEEFGRVEELRALQWSPEQVSGYLRRRGELRISQERISQHLWRDRAAGGQLWQHLRGARKQRRKRYRRKDSRGRLAGKRMIGERPAAVESRRRQGHWEIDTVHGRGKEGVVTRVERKTGYVLSGKVRERTVAQTNAATVGLTKRHPGKFSTLTGDNGAEMNGDVELEAASGAKFYCATPYHSWERGTSENTNGLIRQYLPKRQSMADLTPAECEVIADQLHNRPRKRHGYKTPYQCFNRR